MKLTEKEKEQILKNWAEAMSKIIERMSIEMWELEEENKKLKSKLDKLQDDYDSLYVEKCNASNQWECCEVENKELKIEIWWLMWERDWKEIRIRAYEEDIELLRKENKSLNEEVERLKQNIMQDELEIIPKLEEENKKLKEKLERKTAWQRNHKEHLKEYHKKWRDKNKDRIRAYNKNFRDTHKIIYVKKEI